MLLLVIVQLAAVKEIPVLTALPVYACGATTLQLVWTEMHILHLSLMDSVWTGPHHLNSVLLRVDKMDRIALYQISAEDTIHALVVRVTQPVVGVMEAQAQV